MKRLGCIFLPAVLIGIYIAGFALMARDQARRYDCPDWYTHDRCIERRGTYGLASGMIWPIILVGRWIGESAEQ